MKSESILMERIGLIGLWGFTHLNDYAICWQGIWYIKKKSQNNWKQSDSILSEFEINILSHFKSIHVCFDFLHILKEKRMLG